MRGLMKGKQIFSERLNYFKFLENVQNNATAVLAPGNVNADIAAMPNQTEQKDMSSVIEKLKNNRRSSNSSRRSFLN